MLKLNVNQEKQLTFEVQLGGVQADQIKSYLRIEIDEIEYGFPAEVGRESISVNLPPLRSVTARRLKEGEKAEVKLEIVADGNHLVPWSDTFSLLNPVVVEAKIVEEEDPTPTFKTKLVTEVTLEDQPQVDEPEKFSDEDILTEKIVRKLAKQLASKTLSEQNDEPEQDEVEIDAESDAEVEKEVDESCGTPHKEGISPRDLLDMTKKDVYAYMERAGSKNPQIQDIIYEQAEKAAKSSRPLYVLKQVVKILKTKK